MSISTIIVAVMQNFQPIIMLGISLLIIYCQMLLVSRDTLKEQKKCKFIIVVLIIILVFCAILSDFFTLCTSYI